MIENRRFTEVDVGIGEVKILIDEDLGLALVEPTYCYERNSGLGEVPGFDVNVEADRG